MATSGKVSTKALKDREQLESETYGSAYNKDVVGRFVRYVAALPIKPLVLLAFVSQMTYCVTIVILPWIIKLAVDNYILKGDLAGLRWVVLLFFVNFALNRVGQFFMEFSLIRAGQTILYSLRRDMFAHMQRLSLSFYNKTEVGRLMSRVLGDVGQLQELLNMGVATTGDMITLVGITIALALIDLKLALISLFFLPVLFIVAVLWQPRAKKSFVRARQAISTVNSALNENITGVRVVQSMNREERNLEIFDEKNRENFDATIAAARLSAGLVPIVDILRAISIGAVIIVGARMVAAGDIQVGALLAFLLYIQRFFEPIRSLTTQYTQLQRSMASGQRIFELLDTKPEVMDADNAILLPPARGEIDLKGVRFGYLPGQEIIKGVDLHIDAGETVAIVGPTGAGKTTLISLIARFYDVPRGQGAILVDGYDIRDVTRQSLTHQMSMVLQEPFLFSGTVRENILLDHLDVTNQRIIEAAKAVGAHDFIMKLEDGYDTYLEERGVNLSVGQRQLISFARAIVADPKVLILDEATANIDSNTEMQIQKALQVLLNGRTAIVIAHRLSTIRGADKIVVLDQGRVVEVGDHDELTGLDGLYAHLCRMNYASLQGAIEAHAGPVAGRGFGGPQANGTGASRN